MFIAPKNARNTENKHQSGAVPILLLVILALMTSAYSSLNILQESNPQPQLLKALVYHSATSSAVATYERWQISMRGRTDQWRRHDVFSWYDQRWQYDATSLSWLMVGGNTGHLLGVTDKILMHRKIKHIQT